MATNVLGEILEARAKYPDDIELGVKIGKLYTNMGLPPDMALDRIDVPQDRKIAILAGCCDWLIEHKRNSGANEKAIERQRKTNRKMIEDFITKGEAGVY